MRLPGRLAPTLLLAAAAAAVALLAVPASAHPGSGGAAISAAGILEAERYSAPYAVGCDPTSDSEHTQVFADGGSSAGFLAFIPNDNCGIEFPGLSFPASGKFSSFRAFIGGTTATRTYQVTLFVDGVSTAVASITQSGAPAYVDIPFPSSGTVAAGVHDLRLDAQVTTGPGWVNLYVDCILYDSSASSCFSTTPPDLPPTAAFELDDSRTGCEDSSIQFKDASTDDSAIASHLWEFGDGETSKEPDPTYTYPVAGTYTVRLTVTDDAGQPSTTTRTVTSVGDPQCCPVLHELGSVTVHEGAAVAFDLRATDTDGDPLTYSWTGALPAGATGDLSPGGRFTWTPAEGHAGTYVLEFRVSDGTCTDTRQATVRVEPVPPSEPAHDTDLDGVADHSDNCPSAANRDQADLDRDGFGDLCDPEPGARPAPPPPPAARRKPAAEGGDGCAAAAGGLDADGDGLRDGCDLDADGDGVPERGSGLAFLDNCPEDRNLDQADADADGLGDVCDDEPGTAFGAGGLARARGDAAPPAAKEAPAGVPLLVGGAVLGTIVAVVGALLVVRRPASRGGGPRQGSP